MWSSDDIVLEVEEAEHPTLIATAATPAGTVTLIAEADLRGRTSWLTRVHIQGLSPDALGRAGLNALAAKFLEESDAEALVVEGSPRTTGANPGRPPKPFRYPRERRPAPDRPPD